MASVTNAFSRYLANIPKVHEGCSLAIISVIVAEWSVSEPFGRLSGCMAHKMVLTVTSDGEGGINLTNGLSINA